MTKFDRPEIVTIGNQPFIPVHKRADMNWDAKYYRERANAIFTSASFEPSTAPVVKSTGNKRAYATAVKAAAKVRHNGRQNNWTPGNYVMVGGIPHKMVDGNLVPLSNPVQEKMAAEINKQLHKLAGLKIVK